MILRLVRWCCVCWASSSTSGRVSCPAPRDARGETIDLVADLNAQDDDGFGWSLLSGARDPAKVKVGSMLVAGNSQAIAVVPVVAIDDDGQVHFDLPAPIDMNRHLLDSDRRSDTVRGDLRSTSPATRLRSMTQGCRGRFWTRRRIRNESSWVRPW